MSTITTECDYCLPECDTTTYDASLMSVPFRDCDNKNLGISFLCNLASPHQVSPPKYGKQATAEYERDAPPYVTDRVASNLRMTSINQEDEVRSSNYVLYTTM